MIYLPHRRKAFRSSAFTPNGVAFDGSDDYLNRNSEFTNSPSDGTQFTISFWIKFTARSEVYVLTYANTGGGGGGDYKFRATINAAYKFVLVACKSSDSTIILNIVSSTVMSNGIWYHCIASLDLSDTAKRHLYINGTSDLTAATYNTAETIPFTRPVKWIGSNKTGQWLNGCLSEFWFARTYLDLSVQANREKFRSSTGHPVNLGSDGSLPTGSKPDIYLHSNAAAFGTNASGYGDFTINGGGLSDVTPP